MSPTRRNCLAGMAALCLETCLALMAQTADPLSAVQEHVHPSFRPSIGEMQARLINRTAAGSASTLIHPYSHA